MSSTDRPNIVFIMADDLGYADVSCYGRRDYPTPNIDRLALEGVRFTQAYANSPVCSATRTALMTGQYQYRLPVGLEEPIVADSPTEAGMPPDHPSLPALLRDGGYDTALVGKWHLGGPPLYGPLKSGYRSFYGMMHGAADYFSHEGSSAIYQNDGVVKAYGYKTNLFGDRAVQVVNEAAGTDAPFFLSLHFNAPHWPWEGPNDKAESDRIGTNLRHYDGGSLKVYMAMVQSMDLNIGRVIQALDAKGLSENTIVVFTSDNGGERFSDMWPFIGRKGELLEGGLRIPTIMRWPRRLRAGQVSEQVMMSMDWMPTLLDAAGISLPKGYQTDGESLIPQITGKAAAHSRKLYWRYKASAQRAVRDGDWKYLRIAGNEFLFNLAEDQRERANLRRRHADIFERLKADYDVWNATMLPERTTPPLMEVTGDKFAERYSSIPPKPGG